jgi:hypothetical protein
MDNYTKGKNRFIQKMDARLGEGSGLEQFNNRKFLWNKFLKKRGNPPLFQSHGLRKLRELVASASG